jgi:hypothetical protein
MCRRPPQIYAVVGRGLAAPASTRAASGNIFGSCEVFQCEVHCLKIHMPLLIRFGAGFGGVIAVTSLLVHPYGAVKGASRDRPLMVGADIDPAIRRIVEKSCRDCHSEQTTWPWYGYIAPMSWLIEGDVHDGRSHMNLSRWDEYDLEKKQAILAGIAVMVRNRKMPLPRYLFLHPEAKLADADVDHIYQWARSERRRLKTLASTGAATSSEAGQ